MSILDFFPHNDFREFQQDTLQKIEQAFNGDKEFVILESPTGSGKSAIGICTGLHLRSAFLLTSQKILQDQYTADYSSNKIATLKGRSNYTCIAFPNTTCDDSICSVKPCSLKSVCLYEIAKKKAIESYVALLNYKYFLCTLNFTTSFEKRTLLICDEAHNIDNECMSFVEFNFSTYYLSKLGVTSTIPVYEKIDQYADWLNLLLQKIKKLKAEIQAKLKKAKPEEAIGADELLCAFYPVGSVNKLSEAEIIDLQKELENLIAQEEKITAFFDSYQKVEWIFNIVYHEKTKSKSIEFKPLTIGYFANKLMFSHADKKLLMSATILDQEAFCKNLDIDISKTIFIQVPSTFPKEIRPIILTRTGMMGRDKIETTLPKIVTDIGKILDFHDNTKGLIHAQSYKISNYIKENVDKKYKKRLMFHESETRLENLKSFLETDEPKVLVTPSMTEGIDLKDDLARFVVVVKIPYMFLGDKQIKRKMEIDPEWYNWKAALTLVQETGRGVRHKEDKCHIYIMDSQFNYFMKQNRRFLPDYWVEAIAN
jgi:ATP-dependent DNA helicase DinG